MSDTNVPVKAPAASPPAPARAATPDEPQKLDDVLLAMDVVDTIRHREQVADMELSAAEREEKLIGRLKEIYDAQGIQVPDRILKDGVKALEEQRFVYKPPDPNRLDVKMAKAWVNRRKWLPQTMMVAVLIVISGLVVQFGVIGPRAAEWRNMPAEIARLSAEDQALAVDPAVDAQIIGVAAGGQSAVTRNDRSEARRARDLLRQYNVQLSQTYDVRILNEEGKRSAVYREARDGSPVPNYYLIVEAVDPSGRSLKVPVTNEENRETKTVEQWGQRVTRDTYEQIRRDKTDNGIIEAAIIGHKSVGQLAPSYTIPVMPGAITEW
jgi:hypothetical protein